jgi:hypothetical protein
MGMSFVPLSSTALVGVEPKDAGVASALVNTTQQVGGSLGTALLNTVAASAATTYLAGHVKSVVGVQSAAVHGYTTAFTVSAVLLAGAAVVAGVLIRASRHQEGTDAGSEAVAVEELARLEPVRVEESARLEPVRVEESVA